MDDYSILKAQQALVQASFSAFDRAIAIMCDNLVFSYIFRGKSPSYFVQHLTTPMELIVSNENIQDTVLIVQLLSLSLKISATIDQTRPDQSRKPTFDKKCGFHIHSTHK